MTASKYSDETLMAFVDGELEPGIRDAIETQMQQDEQLAARIAQLAESRARAREALAPLLTEPLPDALKARVEALLDGEEGTSLEDRSEVVAFKRPPPAPRRMSTWRALPIAASLVLVAGAAGLVIGMSQTRTPSGLNVASLDRGALTTALNSVAAGAESDFGQSERFRAIASFMNANGALCREFEVDHADRTTVVAVACRAAEAWEVQFAVLAGQTNEGYAPASSLEALNAYLTVVGAGEPMSPEAEAEALRSLR